MRGELEILRAEEGEKRVLQRIYNVKSKHGTAWGGDQEEGCEGHTTEVTHSYENVPMKPLTLHANLTSRRFYKMQNKSLGRHEAYSECICLMPIFIFAFWLSAAEAGLRLLM